MQSTSHRMLGIHRLLSGIYHINHTGCIEKALPVLVGWEEETKNLKKQASEL